MNRVLAALSSLTPEQARERALAITARFRYQLSAYGGVERADFLDMTNEDFATVIRTLWYGRYAQ